MHHHPYFDLWLHDTDELIELVGSPIAERVTIHEWPLSCVQRLHCVNGQTHIYKVQAPPTVEPAFYRHARSPLVVGAQVLPIEGMPAALLLEDIRAPSLCDLDLPTAAVLSIVDAVVSQIARMEGDLPAMFDIRTETQWLAHAQAIVMDLRVLVDAGLFQQVNAAMIDQVACHSRSAAVLETLAGPTGYVHQDLCAENVLVLADGYKVVDWQRPIWGPLALDRATLLESADMDPAPHVPPGVLQMRTLLLIGWFAQAARYWFPAGATAYDSEIARLVTQPETRPTLQSGAG